MEVMVSAYALPRYVPRSYGSRDSARVDMSARARRWRGAHYRCYVPFSRHLNPPFTLLDATLR